MFTRSCLILLLALGACDRTPEPAPAAPPSAQSAHGTETSRPGSAPAEQKEMSGCIVPLPTSPPEAASSLVQCPADPDGRPVMPWGVVHFNDAEESPAVRVELALTPSDQQHGLMFRGTLPEDAGMLFTFSGEAPRSFWMQNTCLALDMLFIDANGTVVSVLEQVPPWNTEKRLSSCPAKHVLEVNAGWVRRHGIEPGQQVTINVR